VRAVVDGCEPALGIVNELERTGPIGSPSSAPKRPAACRRAQVVGSASRLIRSPSAVSSPDTVPSAVSSPDTVRWNDVFEAVPQYVGC
jgi:hypothetical protein